MYSEQEIYLIREGKAKKRRSCAPFICPALAVSLTVGVLFYVLTRSSSAEGPVVAGFEPFTAAQDASCDAYCRTNGAYRPSQSGTVYGGSCIRFLPELPDAAAGVSAAAPPNYQESLCEPVGSGLFPAGDCIYGGTCMAWDPNPSTGLFSLSAAGRFTSSPYTAELSVPGGTYSQVVLSMNSACMPLAAEEAAADGSLKRGDPICCCEL